MTLCSTESVLYIYLVFTLVPVFHQQTVPSWWSWSGGRSDARLGCGTWRWNVHLSHTDGTEWSEINRERMWKLLHRSSLYWLLHFTKYLLSYSRRVWNVEYNQKKATLVSGSLISTCMPKPGVDGRKEPACLSHSCVLYLPKKTQINLNTVCSYAPLKTEKI